MIDDAPWFAVADVCAVIGRKNPSTVMSILQPMEVNRRKLSTANRSRPNNLTNDAGFYRIIMRSDKPQAREFQDWVFGTGLPAIRKDGGYVENEEKVATGEMDEDELILKAMQNAPSVLARMKVD